MTKEEIGGDNIKLARYLYCLGEKLRQSKMLDDADREFFEEMRKDNAYKDLAFSKNNKKTMKLLTKSVK